MFTFLHDITKPLAENSKMQKQPQCSCLTNKDHPEASTGWKPIYQGKPVNCNFCSHSAKPVWRLQTKWYGKLCRSVVQGAEQVGTESFVSVDFLIHPEQYGNTCMAVLIRRVTCESLFSFWGQRKVLSCKIYLRGLRTCYVSFTAHRSACAFLNCDHVSNLFKEFSGNLHFTHYTQGKYVIQRKFMYL